MGSGERKRCSNMAPVRRLRSLAWIKARKLPGVRCSTLKTECRSLLCLMIMPGRSWVAGMAIAKLLSLLLEPWLVGPWLGDQDLFMTAEGQGSHDCQCGLTSVFYTAWLNLGIGREMRKTGTRSWPEMYM